MKSLITLFAFFLFLPGSNISMMNIHIGDPESALDKMTLEVVAKENNITKYRTDNGNDFSVTTDNGKIVYMENDWLQDTKATRPLCSDFIFGKTTLKDIRQRLGTNGFAYESRRGPFTTDTDLIEFNSFEFDSPGNEILITITKMPLNTEGITEENVAGYLKLDAIIIADKAYLDKTWGKEKSYDKNYKKVKL